MILIVYLFYEYRKKLAYSFNAGESKKCHTYTCIIYTERETSLRYDWEAVVDLLCEMLRRTKAASSTSINSTQRHGGFHGVVAASDAQTLTVHGHDPAISTQQCDICERINTTPVQKTTVHLVARMTKYDKLTELSETNICSTDATSHFLPRDALQARYRLRYGRVCVSVRLSATSWILSKQPNIPTRKQSRSIALGTPVLDAKDLGEIPIGVTPTTTPNTHGE